MKAAGAFKAHASKAKNAIFEKVRAGKGKSTEGISQRAYVDVGSLVLDVVTERLEALGFEVRHEKEHRVFWFKW